MKNRAWLLILIQFLFFSNILAQSLAPVFQGKAESKLEFLYLSNDSKITFHDWNGKGLLSLYDESSSLVDQQEIDAAPLKDEEIILLYLGGSRYFLQTEKHSYNFRIDASKIVIEEKRDIPDGPRGTVKRIFFFDGPKSITVFLNEFEQYNVFVDSADVQIDKKESFGTSHLGNIKQFVQRPVDTPIVTYSSFSKELFFHLPTEVSFLSVSLALNKISYGLIYMEYQQKYTFRRYFDQLADQRFVLKENGDDGLHLFTVSGFDVITFSNEYQSNVEMWPVSFTPSGIVDGKLLLKRALDKAEGKFYEYYLIEIEEANDKKVLDKLTR